MSSESPTYDDFIKIQKSIQEFKRDNRGTIYVHKKNLKPLLKALEQLEYLQAKEKLPKIES